MCRSTSVGSEFYLKLWAELFVKIKTKYLLILKYDLGLRCTPLKLASIQFILKAVLIEFFFEDKIVQMKVYTLAVYWVTVPWHMGNIEKGTIKYNAIATMHLFVFVWSIRVIGCCVILLFIRNLINIKLLLENRNNLPRQIN